MCLHVCTHVHVGRGKVYTEGKCVPASLSKSGGSVASRAQDSLLWLLPPSLVPISLTHISQGLFLGL